MHRSGVRLGRGGLSREEKFQKRVSVKQRVRILCRDTYRCRHTSKWQRVGSCVRITRSNLTRLARVTLPYPRFRTRCTERNPASTRHGRRRFTGRHQERPGDPFAHDVDCWPLGRTTAGYGTTTDKEHRQAEGRLAGAAGLGRKLLVLHVCVHASSKAPSQPLSHTNHAPTRQQWPNASVSGARPARSLPRPSLPFCTLPFFVRCGGG